MDCNLWRLAVARSESPVQGKARTHKVRRLFINSGMSLARASRVRTPVI